jgi:hypothetical protein
MPFKIPGQNETAYTFRSRSHDEMMEWWNDLVRLILYSSPRKLQKDTSLTSALRFALPEDACRPIPRRFRAAREVGTRRRCRPIGRVQVRLALFPLLPIPLFLFF